MPTSSPPSRASQTFRGRPALAEVAAGLVDWLADAALPLWATAGFDAESGRFSERLTLRGERLADAPLRLMTQARQVHAFALAARRGWYPAALDLAEQGFAAMVRDFHGRGGDGGWVFSIGRDGSVTDARRDLYAHAFVLLAIASYVEATGRRDAIALADETLAFIDQRMRASEGGGFVEQLPEAGGPRRQNPHMHLFEGMLALFEIFAETRHRRWLDELFDLFALRFFRAEHGVVGEYFTAGLEPADGFAGRVVEPGHHHEWIWLLRRFERATGRAVQRHVDALYDHAVRFGVDEAGLVVDEVQVDGSRPGRSRRIWPLAEAIRAHVVEARHGRPDSESRAAALAAVLRHRFLTAEPLGGWIDKLDRDGRCLSAFMPASTLYHLIGAIDELSGQGAHPPSLAVAG